MTEPDRYLPRRPARSLRLPLRGVDYHVLDWHAATPPPAATPTLVLLHGWMDFAASFQFVVDALAAADGCDRRVVAPDWRGFGDTVVPNVDSYWFPDYLGDLDALLDAVSPDAPVDLVGHSMGGNVAMVYAGVRPQRVHRLVNLEGFGLPATAPQQAPERLVRWLDELKVPQTMPIAADVDAVAARLLRKNPLLGAARAAWLAPHASRVDGDGRRQLVGDPAHKRVHPVPYRVDETLAAWRRIEAPLLWAEGDRTDLARWWGDRYPRSEFDARLAVVPRVERVRLSPCGHMLHHDQPEALAAHLAKFLASD